jgi:N-acetyl sugar amidotransferase
MKKLVYCTKCLLNNYRPHLEFDLEGVCSGCQTANAKKEDIDWDSRKIELEAIFDKFRNTDKLEYDCIVPVSGGKDSMYQVHMVKNVYNMNPLCITFRTLARTKIGEENLQALREMGVDHIDFAPNPDGVNKLTRKSFLEYGDSSLLDHLAIYSLIPNLALRLSIPLVIWGENPLMEYGGGSSDQNVSKLNREYLKKHNILKGKKLEDWVDEELNLSELKSIIYPSDESLDKLGYTPVFIGYYLPWDVKQNGFIAKSHGFKVRERGPIMGLYDYADLDCMNIVIHHYFKFLKFGFNRISDNASNEIRKGRMTREEGIALARKGDGIKPPIEFIRSFCKQINITEEKFWEVAESFRNTDIWKKNTEGKWNIESWIDGLPLIDDFPHTEIDPSELI